MVDETSTVVVAGPKLYEFEDLRRAYDAWKAAEQNAKVVCAELNASSGARYFRLFHQNRSIYAPAHTEEATTRRAFGEVLLALVGQLGPDAARDITSCEIF